MNKLIEATKAQENTETVKAVPEMNGNVQGVPNLPNQENEAPAEKKKRNKKVAFTTEEDKFLFNGIKKYGQGKWSNILKDPHFKFHPTRKNSTLMMRAKAKKYIE